MTNEIVKRQSAAPATNQALSLANMTPADAWRFAEALAGSGMLPRQYQNNPASVLWALEYGRAIGLDVITTTQSVHVIQGRATASADLMASLTRRAGHRMRISGDDDRAEVVIIRADDPEFEFRAMWDVAKATRAKLLNKDTWQQYRGSMLRARAISECVRMACPEVLHGSIYTPEEIGANVDADGTPVDATVQQLRPVRQAAESDQWATPAATVRAATADVAPESLTPGGRDYLHEALAAPDAATVRLIWQDAKAEGAVPEYLTQIAEVGRQKATAEQTPAAEDVVDVEVVGHDEHTAAEADLRAFAESAGLPTIAADFEGAKGLPLSEATADQIRAFLNELAA
jgi:hypothetical protein